MARPTIGRRLVVAALIVPALLAVSPATRATAARESGVPRKVCSFHWWKGTWHVKKLIRCAATQWPVSGGPEKALSVARCESGFRPRAYNSGGYAGVFQQSTRYWRERAKAFGFPDWSVFNGRANIIVSVRMAHRTGWGDWGCA